MWDGYSIEAMYEEDQLNERKREIPRIDIDNWRRMVDPTFREHFRMRRSMFEKLIVVVGNHLKAKGRLHYIRTPFDVTLMMSVWILATQDSFRSTGTTFGVSKGVVFFHYVYIIEALRELSEKYIRWPRPIERDSIKTFLEDRYGYPGVVGCIECCQLKIYAPKVQPQPHVNRHHAIILQGVCDQNLQYRDVYVGEPGCVGDARTFQRSPLSHNMFRRGGYLSQGEHLLGDGAYPLSEQIMIPFLDDGHLTLRQRSHNYLLSRCRATVERSFARLRGMLRRLKHLPCFRLEYAVDHIMSSLMLHNFIILEGDLPCIPGDEIEPYNVPDAPQDVRIALQEARPFGIQKRQAISFLLQP